MITQHQVYFMDNKALHDQFRQQFTNLHALAVLIISLLEIVGYVVLAVSKIEYFTFSSPYLWHSVVTPIVINAATHFIARVIVNKSNIHRGQKNRYIVAASMITAFVVAIVHREYIVVSCAFIFPMVLSATFNDRKLLKASFGGSVFILLCVGCALDLEGSLTLTTILNLIVLFGLAVVSFLCGRISIIFSGQNYTTIESQAQQNDRLREKVRRDQMTGLYNHNTFFSHLDNKLAAYSPGEQLCLAMLDVDNFKTINDTFGHDSGDTILICLSQILQKYCGIEHAAYRYGGEEFAVIFNGITLEEACSITERALAEFSRYKFPFANTSITFSGGIARFEPGMTRDIFFETADQTLYCAKRNGKNRILKANDPIQV